MKFVEILNVNDLPKVLKEFDSGAKLVSVEYCGCTINSNVNDVKQAILKFKGTSEFCLKFTNVECLHIAPIAMGNISVTDVALGKFRNLFFWADDSSFNITEPDTSLSYCIAGGLFLGK